MVDDAGDTVMELPLPTNVTPQPPVYQFHEAPVPREPPDTLNVAALPEQTGFGLADAPDGADEFVQGVVIHISKVGVVGGTEPQSYTLT